MKQSEILVHHKNCSTKSQIVTALFFKLQLTNLGTSYNNQLSKVTPHNKVGGMVLSDSAHNNQLVENASVYLIFLIKVYSQVIYFIILKIISNNQTVSLLD